MNVTYVADTFHALVAGKGAAAVHKVPRGRRLNLSTATIARAKSRVSVVEAMAVMDRTVLGCDAQQTIFGRIDGPWGIAAANTTMTLRATRRVRGRLRIGWFRDGGDRAALSLKVDLRGDGKVDFERQSEPNSLDAVQQRWFDVTVGKRGLKINIEMRATALTTPKRKRVEFLDMIQITFETVREYGPYCGFALATHSQRSRATLTVTARTEVARSSYPAFLVVGFQKLRRRMLGGCHLLVDPSLVFPMTLAFGTATALDEPNRKMHIYVQVVTFDPKRGRYRSSPGIELDIR